MHSDRSPSRYPPPVVIEPEPYYPPSHGIPYPLPYHPGGYQDYPPRISARTKFVAAVVIVGVIALLLFNQRRAVSPVAPPCMPSAATYAGVPQETPWWQGSWVNSTGENIPHLNLETVRTGRLILPHSKGFQASYPIANGEIRGDGVLLGIENLGYFLLMPQDDENADLYQLVLPQNARASKATLIPVDPAHNHTFLAHLVKATSLKRPRLEVPGPKGGERQTVPAKR